MKTRSQHFFDEFMQNGTLTNNTVSQLTSSRHTYRIPTHDIHTELVRTSYHLRAVYYIYELHVCTLSTRIDATSHIAIWTRYIGPTIISMYYITCTTELIIMHQHQGQVVSVQR